MGEGVIGEPLILIAAYDEARGRGIAEMPLGAMI